MIKIKLALTIPAAIVGAMFGIFFLHLLPLAIFIEVWYGANAYQHPNAMDFMERPAPIIGAILALILLWIQKKDDGYAR